MPNFNIANITRYHLATTTLAILFAILATACDDFYTDSPPTPDIAQPTPANVQEGDPEVLLETAAREAIAAKLGVAPEAPRKILFEYATWTDRNPGCYPAPSSITGAYLIPGFRLLMQHEGIFYEYNSDQGAGTGALCDSTFQLVTVEPARNIVATAEPSEPDFETVYVLRSEEDVADFNSNNSDMATIAVDQIAWEEEVLVGGWVNSSPNPLATRAYRSEQGTLILIEVAIPEDQATGDQIDETPSQTWALVDITDPDSTYEFIVAE